MLLLSVTVGSTLHSRCSSAHLSPGGEGRAGAGLTRSCVTYTTAELQLQRSRIPERVKKPLVAAELAASVCAVIRVKGLRNQSDTFIFDLLSLKITVDYNRGNGNHQHGHGDFQPLCCGKFPP